MKRLSPQELIARHRTEGVLIDSNPLLLLVIGGHDRALAARYKRLSAFVAEDFDVLLAIVSTFRRIYVTPNVLTEVSNLAGALPQGVRQDCFRAFGLTLRTFDEIYVPSAEASSELSFVEYGLTDATVELAASTPALVLTVDLDLAIHLEAKGLPVLNFNHIRRLYWQ